MCHCCDPARVPKRKGPVLTLTACFGRLSSEAARDEAPMFAAPSNGTWILKIATPGLCATATYSHNATVKLSAAAEKNSTSQQS
jgi:hypothetical protein